MTGLFSTFNIAKRGIGSQQKCIDVTSHNVSNVNTEGYSRQRAKIETSRPQSLSSLSSTAEPGQLGTGSEIQAIERVRDTFLDYQIRNETSLTGKYIQRERFLGEIEGIFNEPSDTGISSLIGKFFDSWQQLSKQPQSSNARTVVAQQTLALTDTLNHTYGQLKKLKTNAQNLIKNSVSEINSTLNQIDQVNKEIKGVKATGNNPNDLMDKRDNLLDSLSTKFGITVDKNRFEAIDLRPSDIGKMKSPNLVNADENMKSARFSFITGIEKDINDPSGTTYKLTYYKFGNMDSEENKQSLILKDVSPDQLRTLEEGRVLWASSNGVATKADGFEIKNGSIISASELVSFEPQSGELNGIMSIQNDINNYMKELDRLARSIAFSVNAVHSGLSSADDNNGVPNRDYMPLFVNSTAIKYGTNYEITNLDDTLRGESEISAENITVNKAILEDVMKIKTRTHDNNYSYASENFEDGESDGERALAIAQLRNTLLLVQNFDTSIKSRKDLFNLSKGGAILGENGLKIENNINGMTIDGYFKDTIDRLGVQSQEATRVVDNQSALLHQLNTNKQEKSGVSLDEEMANLVQFQHAYNANAKVISTVDELLDVIINGLKR